MPRGSEFRYWWIVSNAWFPRRKTIHQGNWPLILMRGHASAIEPFRLSRPPTPELRALKK